MEDIRIDDAFPTNVRTEGRRCDGSSLKDASAKAQDRPGQSQS